MNILKIVGLIVGVCVSLVLAVPALLPSTVVVERSVDVKASPSEAYAVLADLNQFVQWNPWSEIEPNVKVQVTGKGLGSTYTWEGEKTGAGKMTLTALRPNLLVQVAMEFLKPMPGVATSLWEISPTQAGGATVNWRYIQEVTYFKRWLGLAMNSAMGPVFEKGLNNLKAKLEKKQ